MYGKPPPQKKSNPMKLPSFLACLLVLAGPTFADNPRPNILMIAVDDLNDWVGAFGGHPQGKTPNLDRLAQRSMVFSNASCPASVCGPSRSALLSGFRPSTTGAYTNDTPMLMSELVQTHATLPEYFSKHGYRTISNGKIFHTFFTENGMDPGHWAYDVWEDASGSGGKIPETVYSRGQGILGGRAVPDAKYTTGGGAEFSWGVTTHGKESLKDYRTAKWFEEQLAADHDKPFFMLAGISQPHLTWFVPQEFYDMHPLEKVIVPEFRTDDLDDIVTRDGKVAFKPDADHLWVQEYGLHQRVVQAYLAASSYADACIGVMLDALAKSKYAHNTIVVIWGDHGWHLGEKLRYRKATLWKEATQLPLIVYLPGMEGRKDNFRNVNLLDLYPTLIELCGLPSKQLEGKSFKRLLENPDLPWTPTLTTMGKGNHSVMGERWHYITRENGVEELYDLGNDPLEWTNLARVDSAEHREVMEYMRKFLPAVEVDSIPRSSSEKRTLDMTIKPKRILAELK
jgi:arylsulfatase A-like enzyme